MQRIEKLAREYAEANARLRGHVGKYNDGVEAVRRKYLPAIRANVSRMEDARRQLLEAIVESPGLFEKPRVVELHGVKLGLKRYKGRVSYSVSAGKLAALIRRHFPELAGALIKVSETPQKDALMKLSARDLRKLGVMLDGEGDAPYVRLADSEGERLVREFLKGLDACARGAA